MWRAAGIASLPIVLLALSAPCAWAARTDVIVLRNSDRLTGEVVHMRQGKLQLKTDDLGTVSIEWDDVAAVTTAEHYDVTIRDGTRLFGQLRTKSPGELEIVEAGGAAVAVAMSNVVSFTAIKATFLQRIDGSFDLGGSYTKSSGVAQVTLETEAVYRRPSYAYAASLSINFTRQPDSPDTSRYSTKLDYTRFRPNRWFVSSFGLLEGNEDLGFTFRGTGAISLGRYLWTSRRTEFLVAGGFAAGREAPVDNPTVTNVDLLVLADWSVFTYDHPTMRVDFGVLMFPSLDDPGRVRLNVDAKFRRELFRDFYFSFSAYDAFDNRPKAAEADQNDFGGSISFGWTF